jgi:hypothetical protein
MEAEHHDTRAQPSSVHVWFCQPGSQEPVKSSAKLSAELSLVLCRLHSTGHVRKGSHTLMCFLWVVSFDAHKQGSDCKCEDSLPFQGDAYEHP